MEDVRRHLGLTSLQWLKRAVVDKRTGEVYAPSPRGGVVVLLWDKYYNMYLEDFEGVIPLETGPRARAHFEQLIGQLLD